MQDNENTEDIRAIEAIIARQFASVSWSPEQPANWRAFAADFFPDATLYPAARPAQQRTVNAFVERMNGLAATKLVSFQERVLATRIRVFGNVAVALVGCEIIENDGESTSRGVEALLLIKNAGKWQIVSQAWDTETEGKPMPSSLLQQTEEHQGR